MKNANIYNVEFKNNTKLTCVATSIYDCVQTVIDKQWNSETNEYVYSKYKEDDITSVTLKEETVIVQDYIS